MRISFLIATAALATASLASAQSFPTRAVTMVVPVPPGGAVDVTARAVADEMSKRLGQPVVVDNKAGASGMLGAQLVARAVPDGHTILLTHGAPILNAPFVFAKVPYQPRKDFAFVTQVATSDLLLVVGKDVPARNLKEFLAWAEQNKGKLSYGSFGAGSVGHLMSAYLVDSRKLDMTHVPYKGEAPLAQDIIGGNVQIMFDTTSSAMGQIKAGKFKPLALTTATRSAELPQVPTLAEAGVSGFEMSTWYGMFVTTGTPPKALQGSAGGAHHGGSRFPRARVQGRGLAGLARAGRHARTRARAA